MNNEGTMSKLKLVVGVILIFIVGALAGSVGTGIYLRQRMEKFTVGWHRRPPETAFLMKRLSKKLDLTDAQRVEIEKIVEEYQEKIFAVRRTFLPEIREITDQSLALIREKLNNEQQQKLDKLHAKLLRLRSKTPFRRVSTAKTVEHLLDIMKGQLKLTQEQETNVRQILEASIKEQEEIVKKYRKQAMSELKKSVEKRLSEILTRDQMEGYRRISEERRFGNSLETHRGRIGGD
jgi:uncharacterized membrane protein